jgi:hypothetical protein
MPDISPALALLRGPGDRKWPLTCGAKGTRTPGLLGANHIFLRISTSPGEPSTCGDCRRLSVGVARSLAPLALCLALLRHSSGFGGKESWRSDLALTASAQVAAVRLPASSAKKPQVKAPIYPLWLLAGSLPGPSGWRLQNRLTQRVSRQASCVAESSRTLDQAAMLT